MKNVPKLRFKEFNGEWEERKLGDISYISSGLTPLRSEKKYYTDATIPWIKTTDLNNSYIIETDEKINEIALVETSIKLLPKNTLLIAMYGGFNQIGRTGLITIEATTNQALSAINFKNKNMNSFFFLNFFNHKVNYWKKVSASSRKDPNITKKDIEDFKICFPKFEEQQKIADFLSSVDKKISITDEKLKLFNEYKKGIMQKIFNQELRFKDKNGNNYPKWEEKKLKNLTKSISNGISLNQNFNEKGYKVTRIETISNGTINLEKVGYIITDKNIEEYKLNIGDLLFSNINSVEHIGKIAYIDKNYNLYHGMNLLRIVFNKNLCSKYFYYVLTERKYKKLFEKLCNKAVSQASINQTELGKVKINFPCLEEQQKIADLLSAIDNKIEKISDELENLKEFKKGLLQQMFV